MEDYSCEEKDVKLKKIHPKEKANFLSTLFFCWAFPMFIKGLKKDLSEEDLYGPLKSHESKTLGDRIQKVWDKEKNSKPTPSFPKILVKVFYGDILFYGFFLVIEELVIKMCQPLIVGKLLDYYVPNQSDISKEVAYLYCVGLISTLFFTALIQHSCFFGLIHLAMKMQVACRSLIYRKALKLNRNALLKRTVGEMVNLMSNDVSRFPYICLHMHQMFLAPIQTLIILYLLFSTVDTAAMVGVGLLMVFIPLQFYMGRLTSYYRLKTAVKTDNRIRLMNEIISGIKVIKMYTWEKPFAKLVDVARRLEIHEIRANSYVRRILMSIAACVIPMSIFLCVVTYVLTGNKLHAQFVFVVSSFYGTLRQTLTLHLPRCIAMIAEINVSLKRIQTFLLAEETTCNLINDEHPSEPKILITDAFFKWTESSPEYTLNNIYFSINQKQLVGVIGRVGSGKTTLLQAILKEIELTEGKLDVRGTISYASQQPWIFSSSIRQNILFGQKMDEYKYRQVVKACALDDDFQLLPYGDLTIVGERGVMLSGGQKARVSLARAIYRDADLYLLDDPLSAVDSHVGKKLFEQCILGYLKNKSVVLVTHQIQYLSNADQIYLFDKGKIVLSGTYSELKTQSGGVFDKLLNEVEEEVVMKQENDEGSVVVLETHEPNDVKEQRTEIGSSGVSYFLTIWVNLEQKRLEHELVNGTTLIDKDFENSFFTTNNLLIMYGSIIIYLIFMALTSSICFVKFSMKASKILHGKMFNQIVRAPMRFFDTNSSGRVLNRFSRDVGVVDETVPPSLSETIQVFLNVIAITVVISSVNLWLLIPTVVIFGFFYGYKTIFLATSRDLKRIEGTARSPLFSHLTASLQGLSTIRAFKAQEILQKEFDYLQNYHSSAFYMFVACSRTFGFWLDMNCIVYVAIVILSFLFIGTETYGGNVGLAITQSITLTGMLQRGIRQWSDLQNHMTSVERIVEYIQVPSEPDKGKRLPPKDWPEEGSIEFDNVSMKYYSDGPYILKQLKCKIVAKEKIGIVGRTGAGKSSLISALFRLASIEGKITIDNVDTGEIPLSYLRSALSIIPQEPVLFSGTLRKNLDPFDTFSDEELWNALEEVELKNTILTLPAGLSSNVSEEGANFSVGERQLLCLARAILRNNKILVLDEATANVDLQTDELIQKTIRKKFKNCTVLTIAHRLYTVMDSDKILVLDNGSIVEMDQPHLLLQNTDGIFYNLVKQTGKAMLENLTKIAHEGYKEFQLGDKNVKND